MQNSALQICTQQIQEGHPERSQHPVRCHLHSVTADGITACRAALRQHPSLIFKLSAPKGKPEVTLLPVAPAQCPCTKSGFPKEAHCRGRLSCCRAQPPCLLGYCSSRNRALKAQSRVEAQQGEGPTPPQDPAVERQEATMRHSHDRLWDEAVQPFHLQVSAQVACTS